MTISGKTKNRTFMYEVYFTSPSLSAQFKAAKLKYNHIQVDKFEQALEAAYALTITEQISEDLFKEIRAGICRNIDKHICDKN